MFDLDGAVREWRRGFARERVLTPSDLDELEDHLRAAYDLERTLDPHLTPARAFTHACETLGRPGAVSREFAKVGGGAWKKVLTAGWILFGASFFLPVIRDGITLSGSSIADGVLPGIQAMLLALRGWNGPVGVLSALTNLVMGATFWRITDAGRGRIRLLAGLTTLGTALNLCWLLADPFELHVGYFAWLTSFAVAGTGLWMRARAIPEETAEHAVVVAR